MKQYLDSVCPTDCIRFAKLFTNYLARYQYLAFDKKQNYKYYVGMI